MYKPLKLYAVWATPLTCTSEKMAGDNKTTKLPAGDILNIRNQDGEQKSSRDTDQDFLRTGSSLYWSKHSINCPRMYNLHFDTASGLRGKRTGVF